MYVVFGFQHPNIVYILEEPQIGIPPSIMGDGSVSRKSCVLQFGEKLSVVAENKAQRQAVMRLKDYLST